MRLLFGLRAAFTSHLGLSGIGGGQKPVMMAAIMADAREPERREPHRQPGN